MTNLSKAPVASSALASKPFVGIVVVARCGGGENSIRREVLLIARGVGPDRFLVCDRWTPDFVLDTPILVIPRFGEGVHDEAVRNRARRTCRSTRCANGLEETAYS